MIEISENGDGITFKVRVVPRASRTAILGDHDGAVKVAIASPPVEGAANAELIKLLAKHLDVPKTSIEILSGATSRAKKLRIDGITPERLRSIVP